jgi:hypothetical protein
MSDVIQSGAEKFAVKFTEPPVDRDQVVAKPAKTVKLKVVATRTGWYGNRRRRTGEKFDMVLPVDEKAKIVTLPSWVTTLERHKQALAAQAAAEERPAADEPED